MIEIVVDKERNLKNLKQIGTPLEENKIYVENLAYSKLNTAVFSLAIASSAYTMELVKPNSRPQISLLP